MLNWTSYAFELQRDTRKKSLELHLLIEFDF